MIMESSSVLLNRPFDRATTWMNSQTASFCHDLEGPKEFQQPRSRVFTRLFFTIAVCLVSVLSVLLFLFAQKSTFRTVRYWGSSHAFELFNPYLASNVDARFDAIYKSQAASTICPCSNTAFTWTSFVEFFTIYVSPPQDPVRVTINGSGDDFCFNTVQSFPLNSTAISRLGCPNLLNSVIDKTDTRTILSSTSLMDPVLLNSTVQRAVLANVQAALNECVFLMSNETDWSAGEPFEWLRNIYDAFKAMLQLYGSNPHAADLEFWEAAATTLSSSRSHLPLVQVIAPSLAIGMQVNWTKYVTECDLMYCDVVEGMSIGSRFFGALAQIGGFGALMLLFVRKIVWPGIRMIGGWKM